MSNANHYKSPAVVADQSDPALKLLLKQAQIASEQTQIALEQTQNALEQTQLSRKQKQLAMVRTHLAWVRTLVMFMSSGFIIDKLPEVFYSNRGLSGKLSILPLHVAGLLMVITCVILSSIEGVHYIRGYHQSVYAVDVRTEGPLLEAILSLMTFLIGIVYIYMMLP